MPRPEPNWITFSIDGLEVRAPENSMLADAAKLGDIEIPVFCYEPKLGQPVGACRMCLIEVEGIPKLQTGCSTPVKDGMVVHTQTERVKTAQESIVEFLLVNHPLDCPVCDKGGECPLQDITFGWGGGRSRFIEPKRHFEKPLELSPLIAIDRERCILCYRCVRYSQEIAEDYQLVLEERGAETFVATFDGHPYVAPFSGNIVELCPVGALTSRPYRFRARPWDVEGAGSICTLCPSQCNLEVTVRDERALRVLARDNEEVDDGWLCDKGRFGYQSIHADERVTQPLIRDGGELRPASWERALAMAASGLGRAGARTAAIVGGETSNEEGFLLQRLLREGLGSPNIDSRLGAPLPLELHRALNDPARQAKLSDLEWAGAVLVLGAEPLDEMPIVDLRLRKAVRRHHMKLAIASERPSALDGNAQAHVRFAPGQAAAFAEDLLNQENQGAGAQRISQALADAEDIVIVYGERQLNDERGARALLDLAEQLEAHLFEIPAGTNARGLREAGVLPGVGPGLEPAPTGAGAQEIATEAANGQLDALYLLHADPLRSHADAALWDRALHSASTVVAYAAFLTQGIREHASVVFPAESYAEKDGTIVHPDGRLQRLRAGIAHQGDTRAGWQVIVELARRTADLDLAVGTATEASEQLFAAVPFYAGLTLEQIGGRGVRWQEQAGAARYPSETAAKAAKAEPEPEKTRAATSPRAPQDAFRLAAFRSIWAGPEVEASPSLHFLRPEQLLEIAPADARRLALEHGARVRVTRASDTGAAARSNGGPVAKAKAQADDEEAPGLTARVYLREAVPAGTVYLQEDIAHDAANLLTGAAQTWVRVEEITELEPALVVIPDYETTVPPPDVERGDGA